MSILKSIIPIAYAEDIIGTIKAPANIPYATNQTTSLIRSILIFYITVAGLFSLFQFIIGGIGLISSSGDKQKVSEAQQKITYAIIGLVTIAASFIITAIVGSLLFGSSKAILVPQLKSIQ